MPSVRLMARPDVLKDLTSEMMDRLSLQLRETVASGFGLDKDDVEAIWLPVESASNMTPLSIEVIYSANRKFDPKVTVRERLAKTLVDMVSSFTWLPPSVTKVASWVRPQRGAIFKEGNRVAATE